MPRPIGFGNVAVCDDPGNASKCNVSSVTTLANWFQGYAAFNGDVSRWNVGSVTDMRCVFHGAATFNVNLNAWDVSSTTSLSYALAYTDAFNQALDNWNTSSVVNLANTYEGASTFNQSLASWDTSSVTSLAYTFHSATAFNGNISRWQVSKVHTMIGTFINAHMFNRDISEWDVLRVQSFTSTFYKASAFNQDLSQWTLSRDMLQMAGMFALSKLSACNKVALRKSWGDEQNSSLFRDTYSHWPRQCTTSDTQCRAWQILGNSDTCEPAMWLDVRSCMADIWNSTRAGTARSDWATPFLGHVPDHLSIKDGACTYLPSFSEVFKRSIDPVVERFGKHLGTALKQVALGDTITHTAGDGVSALVQFEANSSDLFAIKFVVSSNRGLCDSGLEFRLTGSDAWKQISVDVTTPTLSLKHITRSENSPACHGTIITDTTGFGALLEDDVDELLDRSGRLPHEPQVALSWLTPNSTHNTNTSPTMTCSASVSLRWPFELQALVSPTPPEEDHVLEVAILDAVAVRASDVHNVSTIAITGVDTAYIHEKGSWKPLPSDFRGDVTFTATNLLGRTSSCTVRIATFTTQTSWDEGSMDVTGDSKATAAKQSGSSPVYYADSTYSVAGPKRQLDFTNSKLFENHYGNASEIMFEVAVTPQVDGLVYIDQQSGDISISPTSKHLVNETTANFIAVLRGRDNKGAVAVVNRWSFSVKARPVFAVLNYTHSGHRTSGAELVTQMTVRAQSPFAAGEAFRVTAVNLTAVVHADPARCTFTLKGNASTAGVFINPATGAIQGLIDTVGWYQMVLVALDEHGAESELEDVVLDVRKRDISEAAYGPGGKGCGSNGQPVDGTESKFDKQFTCSCDNGFEGDNCDAEVTDNVAIVAMVLTAVIVIMCAIALEKGYQAYTASIAPVDFAAQLQHLIDAGVLPDHVGDQMSDARTPRELPRLWLTRVNRLGSGNFGEVWKCLLTDGQHHGTNVHEEIVAAKQALANDGSEKARVARADLIKEAAVMGQVGYHANVVSLIGVVTRGDPLIVVVSYCEHGDLESALKKAAADGTPFTEKRKLQMCHEVACGMAHLAQCHVIHRDLASRNVLLTSVNSCKVADFGLSRFTASETYYSSRNGIFPAKWTAPEAIAGSKYSVGSDVWSFAITVVEIIQDGIQPYPGVSNPEVLELVTARGDYQTHPQPPSCSDAVYAALLPCWARDPAMRPDFVVLAEEFLLLRNSIIPESSGNDAAGLTDVHTPCNSGNHGPEYIGSHHDVSTASRGCAGLLSYSIYKNVPTINVAAVGSVVRREARLTGDTTKNDNAARDLQRDLRSCPLIKLTKSREVADLAQPGDNYCPQRRPKEMLGWRKPMDGMSIYAQRHPEEMLGWRKPMDVMSIYEDVGRPSVMLSEDGADDTPAKESSEMQYNEFSNPYTRPFTVASVVHREAALNYHTTVQVEHPNANRSCGGRGHEDEHAHTAFDGGRLSTVGDTWAEHSYSQPVAVRPTVGGVAKSTAVRSVVPNLVPQVRACVSVALFHVCTCCTAH